MSCATPVGFAEQVVASVQQSGARGVISHVLKFCDPYLARLPTIRQALRDAGLPMLALERELNVSGEGQLKTRIQAFLEQISTR